MSWLQIVIYIIANAPKLISLIKDLLDLIKGLPKQDADKVKLSLEDAIRDHKLNGDDSVIEKVCLGVGCPPTLKS